MASDNADQFRERHFDVLVSYQRADDAERHELVEALEAKGYDVFWDGKLGPDYWRAEWRSRMRSCKLVIVLWSEAAVASDEVKDEAGGAKAFEKCLSVALDGEANIPKPYLETNRFHWDRTGETAARDRQLARILAQVEQLVGPSRPRTVAVAPTIPVDWGDIPGAPPRLVGRDEQLRMLSDAWERGAPRKTNAVVLHALGGAGKSALLRAFANDLLASGGRGAARVYGWSAYSQGSGVQKRADADAFITKALADFGFEGEAPSDPVERARELAKLIQRQRVLLLLDGLEPLQDPPGVNKGRFKDKGLAELVRILASQNPGLVVLTTRQEVPELEGFGPLVVNHPLEELSPQAGAELLVELGVRGRQSELEDAVKELDGHALSVTLLGTYLSEVCGGAIRHRHAFKFADIVLSPEEQSELVTDKTIIPAKRAAKVIRGYIEQFENLSRNDASAGLGGPEIALLNLIGLFERPADGAAVDALLERHIPGLNDALFFENTVVRKGIAFGLGRKVEARAVSPSERGQRVRRARERLQKLRLLARPNPSDPHELDAHPLVRSYFMARVEGSAAATAAHEILYRFYERRAEHRPSELEQLKPLIYAVGHGVKAGKAGEVFDAIVQERIWRKGKKRLTNRHGAHGTNQLMLAHFFRNGWMDPVEGLGDAQIVELYQSAWESLAALGRLSDAIAIARRKVQFLEAKGDNLRASTGYRELSYLLKLRGDLQEAQAVLRTSIELGQNAGDSSNASQSMFDLAAVTACCEPEGSQLKKLLDAEAANGSEFMGYRGYLIGVEHLGAGNATAALRKGEGLSSGHRAKIAFRAGAYKRSLGHLLVGMAYTQNGAHEKALDALNLAVEELRSTSRMDLLPLALLARAAFYRKRLAREPDVASRIRQDLAEVEDIAGEEMRLHLADLALERAHLALEAPGAFESPGAALEEAEQKVRGAEALIKQTGYHRRDVELADLKRRLSAAGSH
jgi:hypothetical protein